MNSDMLPQVYWSDIFSRCWTFLVVNPARDWERRVIEVVRKVGRWAPGVTKQSGGYVAGIQMSVSSYHR